MIINKKYLIGLVLVSVILVSACIMQEGQKNLTEKNPKEYIEYCMETRAYPAASSFIGDLIEGCFGNLLKITDNTSICDDFEGMYKGICLSKLSEVKSDFSICEDLPSEGIYGEKGCIESTALRNTNSSNCDLLINESRDTCYHWTAFNLNNPDLCEEIVEVDAKDSCYWYISKNLKNPKLCDKINNSETRRICYERLS